MKKFKCQILLNQFYKKHIINLLLKIKIIKIKNKNKYLKKLLNKIIYLVLINLFKLWALIIIFF